MRRSIGFLVLGLAPLAGDSAGRAKKGLRSSDPWLLKVGRFARGPFWQAISTTKSFGKGRPESRKSVLPLDFSRRSRQAQLS
jgi:hypothetical protein